MNRLLLCVHLCLCLLVSVSVQQRRHPGGRIFSSQQGFSNAGSRPGFQDPLSFEGGSGRPSNFGGGSGRPSNFGGGSGRPSNFGGGSGRPSNFGGSGSQFGGGFPGQGGSGSQFGGSFPGQGGSGSQFGGGFPGQGGSGSQFGGGFPGQSGSGSQFGGGFPGQSGSGSQFGGGFPGQGGGGSQFGGSQLSGSGGSGGGRFPGGSQPTLLPHSNALSTRGCFCIPINENCDSTAVVPRTAIKVQVSTRIVNTSPSRACPEETSVCCFGSVGGTKPKPPGPKPPGLGNCGASSTVFKGRRGTAEADFGEYPWMAAIMTVNNDFIATGALIGPFWVLTAAHKLQSANRLIVRLGEYDLEDPNEFPRYPHETFNVEEVILHPQFNPENLFNDVALVRLSGRAPTRLPHIQPVCLPEQNQKFLGKRCYVSGWGISESGRFSNIMREVDVPVVGSEDCSDSLRKSGELGRNFRLNTTSFMCAGGETGKDACRGDGGAPLVCEEFQGTYTVAGLVAWGLKQCGQRSIPGVYVNVAGFSNYINSYVN